MTTAQCQAWLTLTLTLIITLTLTPNARPGVNPSPHVLTSRDGTTGVATSLPPKRSFGLKHASYLGRVLVYAGVGQVMYFLFFMHGVGYVWNRVCQICSIARSLGQSVARSLGERMCNVEGRGMGL